MAKPKQEAFTGDGFQQERVSPIENACDRADETRSQIGGLTDELKTRELNLREVVRENESQCDHQDDGRGGNLIVYKRGDYSIVVQAKESVKYKVRERSKGAAR